MSKGSSARASFTLIELLVVIAILAVLSVGIFLVINPRELLSQSRDSIRFSDAKTIESVIGMIKVYEPPYFYGTTSVIYVSLPDSDPNCSNNQLPDPPAGFTYNCVPSETFRSVDGTGWIPINFNSFPAGSPISKLPVDPENTSSSGKYYIYVVNPATSQWTLNTPAISQKYKTNTTRNDGGYNPFRYEVGTAPSLASSTVFETEFLLCGDPLFYAGKYYSTVQISTQCWMKQNLNVGTMVSTQSSPPPPCIDWGGGAWSCQVDDNVLEKYCLGNSETHCSTYGALYEWQEAMGFSVACATQSCSDQLESPHQGICPSGWHIPNDSEWNVLELYTKQVAGVQDPQYACTTGQSTYYRCCNTALTKGVGKSLKAIGQGWGNGAGDDLVGFSALLTSMRDVSGSLPTIPNGLVSGSYWEPEENSWAGHFRYIYRDVPTIMAGSNSKMLGMSIRCIKD